ncbi:GIY-YIG nuclease family protein [Thermovibrio ammonificans]
MKGSYCLIFRLTESTEVETKGGKRFTLEAGIYCYAGSAFGPGGVEARVSRHLRREKKLKWHIDFVTTLRCFEPEVVAVLEGKRAECLIAGELSKLGEPVKGFGSTDCKCPSHLIKLESPQSAYRLLEKLGAKIHKTFSRRGDGSKRNP